MKIFEKLTKKEKAENFDLTALELSFYADLMLLKNEYSKKIKTKIEKETKNINNIVFFNDLKKEKERFFYEF